MDAGWRGNGRVREWRVRLSAHEALALGRCLALEQGVELEELAVRLHLLRAEPALGRAAELCLTALADRAEGLCLELSREEGPYLALHREQFPATAAGASLRPNVLRELFPELPRSALAAHVWSGRRTRFTHAEGWELSLDEELRLSVHSPASLGLTADELAAFCIPTAGALRWRGAAPPRWLEQVVRSAAPLDLRREALTCVREAQERARLRAEEHLIESWFQ